jgi:hypothetical protein
VFDFLVSNGDTREVRDAPDRSGIHGHERSLLRKRRHIAERHFSRQP